MKITIYSSEFCGYCRMAKQLFKKLSLDYEEIDVDAQPQERQRISKQQNNYATIPMIFIDEKFIGGFTELRSLQAQGKL